MATPKGLHLGDWNDMVPIFHGESDRGAAVLAGGFVDHYLGVYLYSLAVDPKVAKELFAPMGPLSSFSQRIACAYAFRFIDRTLYDDLTLIRRIRNHFAHHPHDATFDSELVATDAAKLSTASVARKSHPKSSRELNRDAFLFACCMFCVYAHNQMRRLKEAPLSVAPTARLGESS